MRAHEEHERAIVCHLILAPLGVCERDTAANVHSISIPCFVKLVPSVRVATSFFHARAPLTSTVCLVSRGAILRLRLRSYWIYRIYWIILACFYMSLQIYWIPCGLVCVALWHISNIHVPFTNFRLRIYESTNLRLRISSS